MTLFSAGREIGKPTLGHRTPKAQGDLGRWKLGGEAGEGDRPGGAEGAGTQVMREFQVERTHKPEAVNSVACVARQLVSIFHTSPSMSPER